MNGSWNCDTSCFLGRLVNEQHVLVADFFFALEISAPQSSLYQELYLRSSLFTRRVVASQLRDGVGSVVKASPFFVHSR